MKFKFLASMWLIGSSLFAQDYSKVKITSDKLSDKVHMIMGYGGNLGLFDAGDGYILIDDQFAPLTDKIKAVIKKIGDKPVKFVLNTHWHFDHTGGNEKFAKDNSVVIAQENVRKRMSTDQFIKALNMPIKASPKEALPVITFKKGIKFHLNDEELDVMHIQNAHTDGDSIVHFKKANIIHTGDIFNRAGYPFIDYSSGGTPDGFVKALEKILEISNKDTVYIPGHGPKSNYKELVEYHQMVKTLVNQVKDLIKEGKNLEQIKKMNITKEYDKKWANGFIKTDNFVTILYTTLK